MTKFEYTHEWVGQGADFKSTSVDNVWYNENNRTAVIDWNDKLYSYSGVSLDEVLHVVSGGSVGTAANMLKYNRGPGSHLGSFWNVDFKKVGVLVSLTKAVSLKAPTAVVASKTKTYTFYFDLNGVKREHTVSANEMDEAIALLEDGAKALGSDIVVKEVLVKFV